MTSILESPDSHAVAYVGCTPVSCLARPQSLRHVQGTRGLGTVLSSSPDSGDKSKGPQKQLCRFLKHYRQKTGHPLPQALMTCDPGCGLGRKLQARKLRPLGTSAHLGYPVGHRLAD